MTCLTRSRSFLPKNKQYKVLDLGIGGANLAKYVVKNPLFSLTGLDFDENLLNKVTRKRVDIPLVVGDAEKMPFEDESFDIIVHNQTLHHFPSIERVLGDIHRVLKKDGLLFSIETNGWNPLVKYGHTTPWTKKKRLISSNQKVFSYVKFKKELGSANFKILGWKMINFGFVDFSETLERFFSKLPLIRLFYGGSMVVCSQKS